MNALCLTLCLLFSNWTAPADSADSAYEVKLQVEDVRESTGQMIIKIYREDNDFLSHDTFKLLKVKASSPKTITTIALPEGKYAIAVYQDIDMSGRLNKSFIGLPKEPVGISNDAISGLSKPSFEEAAFEVKDNISVSIDLKYY